MGIRRAGNIAGRATNPRMTSKLGWIDWTVLLAALASAIAVGLWTSRRNKTADAFLYAERSMPWWAILGSIVATETSAATVLSVAGYGYSETGMKFVQIGFGLLLGRLFVAWLFMPMFFAGRLSSAYEVLEQRCGVGPRRFAGAMFLVARNLGDGLRLFLGALVMQELIGVSLLHGVLIVGGVTIVYTCLGGIRSIVWNDCIQLLIYMVGGVATLIFLADLLPGGWHAMTGHAVTDKLNPFDFGFDLSNKNQFWAAVLGGAVLGMGTHGTDQMFVQRYLSTKTWKQASLALSISGVVVVFQFALFLFIGICLGVFYADRADAPAKTDAIYQHFIVHHFPQNTGLAGLMLAAVLAATMSTLSSSFSASASSLLNDFVKPRLHRPLGTKRELHLSQVMAVGFGVLQIVIGFSAQWWGGTVVNSALAISSFVFGVLLGMFALAVIVPHANTAAVLIAAAVSLIVVSFVQFGMPLLGQPVAAYWLAVIGSGTALLVGTPVAYALPRKVRNP